MLCLLVLLCSADGTRPPVGDSVTLSKLDPAGNLQLAVDDDRRSLWVRSEVVLRDGVLEMLLCRTKTKEHESILATPVAAQTLQAGLIAAGLKPGTPAQFEPDYRPPTGQTLAITLHWTSGKGPHQGRSQDWVRHAINRWHAAPLPESIAATLPLEEIDDLRYFKFDKVLLHHGSMTEAALAQYQTLSDDPAFQTALKTLHAAGRSRPMDADWIFAGSEWREFDGVREFAAESGNYVCVANFSDAIVDIDQRSSNENGALQYEPWTERVPPVGTAVWVEFAAAKPTDGAVQQSADRPNLPEE